MDIFEMSKTRSTTYFITQKRAFFILEHNVGVFYKVKKKIVTEKKKLINKKYLATFLLSIYINENLSERLKSS